MNRLPDKSRSSNSTPPAPKPTVETDVNKPLNNLIFNANMDKLSNDSVAKLVQSNIDPVVIDNFLHTSCGSTGSELLVDRFLLDAPQTLPSPEAAANDAEIMEILASHGICSEPVGGTLKSVLGSSFPSPTATILPSVLASQNLSVGPLSHLNSSRGATYKAATDASAAGLASSLVARPRGAACLCAETAVRCTCVGDISCNGIATRVENIERKHAHRAMEHMEDNIRAATRERASLLKELRDARARAEEGEAQVTELGKTVAALQQELKRQEQSLKEELRIAMEAARAQDQGRQRAEELSQRVLAVLRGHPLADGRLEAYHAHPESLASALCERVREELARYTQTRTQLEASEAALTTCREECARLRTLADAAAESAVQYKAVRTALGVERLVSDAGAVAHAPRDVEVLVRALLAARQLVQDAESRHETDMATAADAAEQRMRAVERVWEERLEEAVRRASEDKEESLAGMIAHTRELRAQHTEELLAREQAHEAATTRLRNETAALQAELAVTQERVAAGDAQLLQERQSWEAERVALESQLRAMGSETATSVEAIAKLQARVTTVSEHYVSMRNTWLAGAAARRARQHVALSFASWRVALAERRRQKDAEARVCERERLRALCTRAMARERQLREHARAAGQLSAWRVLASSRSAAKQALCGALVRHARERARRSVARWRSATEAAGTLSDELSKLAEAKQQHAIALAADRATMLASIEHERAAVQAQQQELMREKEEWMCEREAAREELMDERQQLLSDVDNERTTLHQQLQQQRETMMKEIAVASEDGRKAIDALAAQVLREREQAKHARESAEAEVEHAREYGANVFSAQRVRMRKLRLLESWRAAAVNRRAQHMCNQAHAEVEVELSEVRAAGASIRARVAAAESESDSLRAEKNALAAQILQATRTHEREREQLEKALAEAEVRIESLCAEHNARVASLVEQLDELRVAANKERECLLEELRDERVRGVEERRAEIERVLRESESRLREEMQAVVARARSEEQAAAAETLLKERQKFSELLDAERARVLEAVATENAKFSVQLQAERAHADSRVADERARADTELAAKLRECEAQAATQLKAKVEEVMVSNELRMQEALELHRAQAAEALRLQAEAAEAQKIQEQARMLAVQAQAERAAAEDLRVALEAERKQLAREAREVAERLAAEYAEQEEEVRQVKAKLEERLLREEQIMRQREATLRRQREEEALVRVSRVESERQAELVRKEKLRAENDGLERVGEERERMLRHMREEAQRVVDAEREHARKELQLLKSETLRKQQEEEDRLRRELEKERERERKLRLKEKEERDRERIAEREARRAKRALEEQEREQRRREEEAALERELTKLLKAKEEWVRECEEAEREKRKQKEERRLRRKREVEEERRRREVEAAAQQQVSVLAQQLERAQLQAHQAAQWAEQERQRALVATHEAQRKEMEARQEKKRRAAAEQKIEQARECAAHTRGMLEAELEAQKASDVHRAAKENAGTLKEAEVALAKLQSERAHEYGYDHRRSLSPTPVLSLSTKTHFSTTSHSTKAPIGSGIRAALAPVKPWGDDGLV